MNVKPIKHHIVKIAPKFALRLYKLYKIAQTPAYRSPDLPDEVFEDAKVVAHRDRLLDILPKNGKVAFDLCGVNRISVVVSCLSVTKEICSR